MANTFVHGKGKQVRQNIKNAALSADGKSVTQLTANERNALLVLMAHKLGLVDDDGNVDLSSFNGL